MRSAPTAPATPRLLSRVLLGVTLLLAVIAVNAIVSVRATRALIEKNNRVEHTRMVTDELDATLSTALNMETGERGYLYTGERRYLEPYDLGKPELVGHVDRLASLTADNPAQQATLARLRPALQDMLAFFEQAIAFEAAGNHDAAKVLVRTGGGKAKMDVVRTALAEMKAEELKLLAVRSAESQRSEHYLLLTIPASHAFTAILLVFAGLLVGRNLRKRLETARRLRELAEREHDARELAEAAHQRTESVLSGISEMFTLLDRNWRIVYVNEQVIRLTGKPRAALMGQEYWKVYPEMLGTKVEEAYRRSMDAQKPEAFEALDISLRKWFSIHLYPSPEALTIFAQDITAMKQAQDALVRAEKLAAVGRMASTVAHEINNPLEAVTNLIWIARNDPSASDSVRRSLGIADDELRRVAHIAKQTLGFYRDSSAPAVVKMREVMNNVLALYASRLTSKQISVRTEYEDCAVFGYAGELRQLFSNLCANAVDAVETRGNIWLRVSGSRAWRNSNQPGIRVTIADDGCGIAAHHRDNLFEPFFTTKNATGTGLGLWVAKQIAKKHGGWISVRSKARPSQHYTVVSVFLPLRAEGRSHELAAAG